MADVSFRVRYDTRGIALREWMITLPKELRRYVVDGVSAEAGEFLKDYAAFHHKKGKLVDSYFERDTYEGRGKRIGFDLEIAPHAKWLNEGARPHEIKPVRARSLVFFWPRVGRVVFLKRVWHPGYLGDRYIDRANEFALDRINTIVDEFFTKG